MLELFIVLGLCELPKFRYSSKASDGKSFCEIIQKKAVEQCFHGVFLTSYAVQHGSKVRFTDKTLVCDHSNESY